MKKEKTFRIDARAILTWGRESIRDHTTAILELVKNSYDAGASIVEVEVNVPEDDEEETEEETEDELDEEDDENDEEEESDDEEEAADEEGYISITDDGEGMSEEDVDKNWLSIGYSHKRTAKKTRAGRRKTGEKGVGRISADRLGATLELRTQKKLHPSYGLFVDWSLFEESGCDVDDIPITPVESPHFLIPRPAKQDDDGQYLPAPAAVRNSLTKSGTQLLIKELRDTWTKGEIQELRDALSVLTPPFGGVQDFQIRLRSNLDVVSNEVIESPFFKTAELELTCTLDKAGKIKCESSGRSQGGKRLRPKIHEYKWNEFVHGPEGGDEASLGKLLKEPVLGPVRVVLLFFPRRAETLRGTELLMSDLREFLNQNSGVKVYRDNIRVAPYGEPLKPEGDWLGLGERKAQNPAGPGRKDFRIAPGQLVGAVFITRDGNPEIADTTACEGLVHGDAFYQLKAFLRECIVHLEGLYHQTFLEEKKKEPVLRPREVVGVLRERLKELTESLEDVSAQPSSRKAERALELITSATSDLKQSEQSIEELATQAIVYRALATLGIAASTFGHETLGSIEGVEFSVKEAMEELKVDDPDLGSVMEELEKALRFTSRISAWGKFALGRIKRDKRRRRYRDIGELVRDLVEEVRVPFDGSSIDLKLALRNCEGKVFPMDVEAVLLNLLTNAYFFAKKSNRNRVIRIEELLSNLVDERASGGGGLGFESVGELNSGDHFGQELGAV